MYDYIIKCNSINYKYQIITIIKYYIIIPQDNDIWQH